MAFDELLDRRVERIYLSDYNQRYMKFDVSDSGSIVYCTSGDGLSISWFSNILGVSALLGHVIEDISELDTSDYNTDDGRCRQSIDRAYGYGFKTDDGEAQIVYRNSSDGDGFGEVVHIEDMFKLSSIVWRVIERDYR